VSRKKFHLTHRVSQDKEVKRVIVYKKTKAVENIETHILSSIRFPENRDLKEIMWKNTVQSDRSQVTI
jgi:hypothetical protein